MSYVGKEPQTDSLTQDLFSGDGSTVAFTLSHAPGSASALIVQVGGIQQVPSQGYTVSGGTITFTSAPPTGTNNISVVHLGVEVQIPTPADGSVSQSKIDTTSLNPVVQSSRTDDGEVATGTTTIPIDDTIPQNTEGDEYMTVSITPTSATNLLVIESQLILSSSVANSIQAALFQDSTANALAVVTTYQSAATGEVFLTMKYKMAAGTTSSTTFKVRAGGGSAGTTTFNGDNATRRFGGVMNSYIEVTEVAQ